MKLEILLILALGLVLPVNAQIKPAERKSRLDSDPTVVYLEQTLKQPIELKVIKEAPVFSDKEGSHRLGTIKANQTVKLEALTEKIYRVRGQGTHDGIAGWVGPWAFSSPSDPDFVANFKLLYERQIQVQNLIANQQVAIGMTLDEVTLAKGPPTKTTLRKTTKGQSGRWEFIEYEDIKNYATEVDRSTGYTYRRLISITRQEKGKTTVEFIDDVVSAIEESEDHQGGSLRVIVPPILFRW
jgi:hypothetical protein